MKLALFHHGKNNYEKECRKFEGIELVVKNPDIVLCIGGDGTLLEAERVYPGIPKVLYKKSLTCEKCVHLTFDKLLNGLARGKYKIEKWNKLEFKFGKKKFLAMNDVIFRNKNPLRAIRFRVKINGKDLGLLFVGDGLIVCSAFGSHGYFRSITGKSFEKGIGIAFNNLARPRGYKKDLKLDINSKVEVIVDREDGELGYDNDEKNLVKVKAEDKFTVTNSKEVVNLISFGDLFKEIS